MSSRRNNQRTPVGSSCRNIQLFSVLSDTLISWSAGIITEQLWPKAVHRQIPASQLLVRIRWVVGRWLVRASVSSVVLSTQCSLRWAISSNLKQFQHQTQRTWGSEAAGELCYQKYLLTGEQAILRVVKEGVNHHSFCLLAICWASKYTSEPY